MKRLSWALVVAMMVPVCASRAESVPDKVCSLMDQSTAAAIAGKPVEPGVQGVASAVLTECDFEVGSAKVAVGVLDSSKFGGATPAQAWAATTSQPPDGATVKQLSLGDSAIYWSSSTSSDVWVLHGNLMLNIDSTLPPSDAQKAAMIAAAKVALGRL